MVEFILLLLDDGVVLVLHHHVLTHVDVGGGSRQTVEDALHVAVALVVESVVQIQRVLVFFVGPRLVEDAEHLVQPVVDLAVQARNLHDDTVVHQTLHERVGNALRHQTAVVVVGVVAHVDDGLLDVAQRVAQKIDRDHGQGVAVGTVLDDVARILILRAHILAETQRLRG